MGKKGEETSTPELALTTKMDLLKGKVALIEKVMQKQSLEFRYEMASSQAKLQVDIKDQLDDFLSSMMKFKSPTPPPHAKPPESIVSRMGQATEYQYLLGEKTLKNMHPNTLNPHMWPVPNTTFHQIQQHSPYQAPTLYTQSPTLIFIRPTKLATKPHNLA
jgi:hypothetical protein